MAAQQVLRTPDAAKYLALSASTLEKMRGHGTGPRFVRLTARAIGYTFRDLDEWLDRQRNTVRDSEGD